MHELIRVVQLGTKGIMQVTNWLRSKCQSSSERYFSYSLSSVVGEMYYYNSSCHGIIMWSRLISQYSILV